MVQWMPGELSEKQMQKDAEEGNIKCSFLQSEF